PASHKRQATALGAVPRQAPCDPQRFDRAPWPTADRPTRSAPPAPPTLLSQSPATRPSVCSLGVTLPTHRPIAAKRQAGSTRQRDPRFCLRHPRRVTASPLRHVVFLFLAVSFFRTTAPPPPPAPTPVVSRSRTPRGR